MDCCWPAHKSSLWEGLHHLVITNHCFFARTRASCFSQGIESTWFNPSGQSIQQFTSTFKRRLGRHVLNWTHAWLLGISKYFCCLRKNSLFKLLCESDDLMTLPSYGRWKNHKPDSPLILLRRWRRPEIFFPMAWLLYSSHVHSQCEKAKLERWGLLDRGARNSDRAISPALVNI